MKNIVEIKDLSVVFQLRKGNLKAVNHVSLDIRENEIIGLVGESGSGKSTLASTLLRIVSSPGKIIGGEILYEGNNILMKNDEEMRIFRWQDIAMIFQAAQNSMNPLMTVKEHFLDTVRAHKVGIKEDAILEKIKKLCGYVRLDWQRVLNAYPHELSGGMKQRVIIALSLILDPKVLILDEPTTALDVITQAYILEMLKEIQKELGITLIFLSHDVSVVGYMADRIAVMYAGEIVEIGESEAIFNQPQHPYTQGLIAAQPSLTDDVTKRKAIPGNPPDLIKEVKGCKFSPRCTYNKTQICCQNVPMYKVTEEHWVRCCQVKGGSINE